MTDENSDAATSEKCIGEMCTPLKKRLGPIMVLFWRIYLIDVIKYFMHQRVRCPAVRIIILTKWFCHVFFGKWIPLFSKDVLNRSKPAVKTVLMLQKILYQRAFINYSSKNPEKVSTQMFFDHNEIWQYSTNLTIDLKLFEAIAVLDRLIVINCGLSVITNHLIEMIVCNVIWMC